MITDIGDFNERDHRAKQIATYPRDNNTRREIRVEIFRILFSNRAHNSLSSTRSRRRLWKDGK